MPRLARLPWRHTEAVDIQAMPGPVPAATLPATEL